MTLNENTYEDDYKDTCTKLIFSNIIFFGGGAKSKQDQLIIAMPDTEILAEKLAYMPHIDTFDFL